MARSAERPLAAGEAGALAGTPTVTRIGVRAKTVPAPAVVHAGAMAPLATAADAAADAPLAVADAPLVVADAPPAVTNAPLAVADAPLAVADAPLAVADAPLAVADAARAAAPVGAAAVAAPLVADASAAAALAAAPLAVEELRDRAAIAALRPGWEQLARAMAEAGSTRGPFLSPDWFAIYAASLTDRHDAGRLGELRILVVHRAGRLLAVLPLVAEKRRLAGAPARLLRSLSDDHSQRFDLLLAPGAEGDAAARALVSHLSRRRDWDAVELQSVLADGSAAARLVAAARAAGFGDGEWASMRSPYLPLPASGDELDRQLGSKFRGNLRRRAKKLAAEVGAVALERVDGRDGDAAALDALLDEGFALEAAGWKGELGTAIACDARLRRHYRALAHAFARRGQLACYFLTAGGRRVAFHFAVVDERTYYLFKPGFDPALASYGLGHLLVDAAARDLIARGVTELDFLGDDMPWKRDWTDQLRPHSFFYLFAPTLRGRALAAWKLRLVPLVKQLAPAARSLWSRLHRS